MAFTYDPSTVVDKEFMVLPEGNYSFETICATESISRSSGKDMLVIDVNVFGQDGKKYPHSIYITDKSLFHLKNFWDSVGHPELFESMGNDLDGLAFMGKFGVLKTAHEESEYGGTKHTKSKIHYFIKKKDQENIEPTSKTQEDAPLVESFDDDEIPF